MVKKLIDVRGTQLLSLGNQKDAVGGVNTAGEHHAGAELGQKNLPLALGQHGLRQGTEKGPDRIGIKE